MQTMLTISPAIKISGCLNLTFSFFTDDFKRSIILYFEMIKILKIITSINIMPKYSAVLPTAGSEKINLYDVISKSNSLTTTNDKTCDKTSPIIRPQAKDKIPTIIVSHIKIPDILDLLIPSIIYSPNSLFLLLIKKLLAYRISPPSMIDTNIDMSEIPSESVSITSAVPFFERSNITFCAERELKL